MESDRIAIVGVGLVSAGGTSLDDTWQTVLAGRSTVSALPAEIAQYVRPKYGHSVPVSTPRAYRLGFIADIACQHALSMAQLDAVDLVCVGSTSSSFRGQERSMMARTPIQDLPGDLADYLKRTYRAKEAYQTSQACASSSYAIALAADRLRLGYSNVALAGGADELAACVIDSFDACGIYSDQCLPFTKGRKGLVLGEAAAFVAMTTQAYADLHGMHPIAFLDGIGLSCDTYDMAAPHQEGIERAIWESTRDTPFVDFICAHGTGTELNDKTEAGAICEVFAPNSRPLVASYKGALGHPQGASGAVGVALAIKAMEAMRVFPTLTMGHPVDSPLGIDVLTETRPMDVRRALVLSYGSWGANAALLLSKE